MFPWDKGLVKQVIDQFDCKVVSIKDKPRTENVRKGDRNEKKAVGDKS